METQNDTMLVEQTSSEPLVSAKYFYLEHLKKMNDVFYDQIKTADQKAAYLFTFMLAFLLSSAEGRTVFSISTYTDGGPIVILLSGVMAVAILFTLISAIMVVLPRKAGNPTSLFWGAWPQQRSLFLDANSNGDPDYLLNEYLGNVDNLSIIARDKFLFVSLSFRGLLVSVVCFVLLLTFGGPA